MTAEALQAIDAKGAAWLACKGGDVLGTAEAKTRYAPLKNLARRLIWRDKGAHLEAHAQGVEEAFRDHKWHDAYKHLKTLGADQEVSLTPVAHAAKQRGPVGSKTGMIGKHTHGHTLTHRSTRRETDAQKTRA